MANDSLPVLCIGGLDPCGGAGLFADARAVAAFGAQALSVATAIVAQNTREVTLIEPIAPEIVAAQIEALLADIEPAAIKIGMIPGISTAEVIIRLIRPLRDRVPIVVDPVFAPTSGPAFCDSNTIDYVAGQLLPLAHIVTPNLLEAEQLCGVKATDLDTMAQTCVALFERVRSRHILLKGGHLPSERADASPLAVDLFFNGERFLELRAVRENHYDVRGTGCLLASALAAQLADGKSAIEAARGAKVWLTQQIRSARVLGEGGRLAGF